MLLVALCRFVTSELMSPLAAVRRLTAAPMTPRFAETWVIALLTAVRDAVAVLELCRSLVERPNAADERALMLVLICVLAADATVLPSLRKTSLWSGLPPTTP